MSTRAFGCLRRYTASRGVSSDDAAVSWWRLQGRTRSTVDINSPSERDQALHPVLTQAGAPVQIGKLDQEPETDDHAAERFDQAARCGRGAPRSQHIVHHQDPLARVDRVAMNLELVGAVLELVLLTRHRPRQLARLPNRNETRTQAICDRGGEDEAPRLDADNAVDGDVVEPTHQVVDRTAEGGRVTEQGRDVAKRDAGVGIVGDRANVLTNPTRIAGHGTRLPTTSTPTFSAYFSCAAEVGATAVPRLALACRARRLRPDRPSPHPRPRLPAPSPSEA